MRAIIITLAISFGMKNNLNLNDSIASPIQVFEMKISLFF